MEPGGMPRSSGCSNRATTWCCAIAIGGREPWSAPGSWLRRPLSLLGVGVRTRRIRWCRSWIGSSCLGRSGIAVHRAAGLQFVVDVCVLDRLGRMVGGAEVEACLEELPEAVCPSRRPRPGRGGRRPGPRGTRPPLRASAASHRGADRGHQPHDRCDEACDRADHTSHPNRRFQTGRPSRSTCPSCPTLGHTRTSDRVGRPRDAPGVPHQQPRRAGHFAGPCLWITRRPVDNAAASAHLW